MVSAHREGRFTLSVPALLPLVEVCRSRSWEMQRVMKMPSKRSPKTGSSESRKYGRKYLRTLSSTWSTNAMIFALTQPHIRVVMAFFTGEFRITQTK